MVNLEQFRAKVSTPKKLLRLGKYHRSPMHTSAYIYICGQPAGRTVGRSVGTAVGWAVGRAVGRRASGRAVGVLIHIVRNGVSLPMLNNNH